MFVDSHGRIGKEELKANFDGARVNVHHNIQNKLPG